MIITRACPSLTCLQRAKVYYRNGAALVTTSTINACPSVCSTSRTTRNKLQPLSASRNGRHLPAVDGTARRRCCSNYAGEMAEQERSEAEQFVVTGSLLDARRAGADVPLVGQLLQVSARFGPDAVAAFAKHAGDDNPIHLDDNYARRGGYLWAPFEPTRMRNGKHLLEKKDHNTRSYDGCIVHGLMVAGLFSTAFGRSIPGALYVSQSLRFEHPVRLGEWVTARIEVERARITSSKKEVLARCSTVASLQDGTVVVSGQAQVLLPRSCCVRASEEQQ